MRSYAILIISFSVLLGPAECSAQYRIVLKNGREVSVDDYREEGPWIRATVFGGEVSFPKESLSRIERTDAPTSPGAALSPVLQQQPGQETGQEVTGLDREIERAQGEFLEARRRGASADEIKQKQVSWNRLRLERFRLLRKLNESEEASPSKK